MLQVKCHHKLFFLTIMEGINQRSCQKVAMLMGKSKKVVYSLDHLILDMRRSKDAMDNKKDMDTKT